MDLEFNQYLRSLEADPESIAHWERLISLLQRLTSSPLTSDKLRSLCQSLPSAIAANTDKDELWSRFFGNKNLWSEDTRELLQAVFLQSLKVIPRSEKLWRAWIETQPRVDFSQGSDEGPFRQGQFVFQFDDYFLVQECQEHSHDYVALHETQPGLKKLSVHGAIQHNMAEIEAILKRVKACQKDRIIVPEFRQRAGFYYALSPLIEGRDLFEEHPPQVNFKVLDEQALGAFVQTLYESGELLRDVYKIGGLGDSLSPKNFVFHGQEMWIEDYLGFLTIETWGRLSAVAVSYTTQYFSTPEFLQGRDQTEQTLVYSWAALLFFYLSTRHTVRTVSDFRVYQDIMGGRLQKIDNIRKSTPAGLAKLIEASLAVKMNERPSPEEFFKELSQYCPWRLPAREAPKHAPESVSETTVESTAHDADTGLLAAVKKLFGGGSKL